MNDAAHERSRDREAITAFEAADIAKAVLTKLLGREAENVSSVERSPEGWQVTLEVVEVERVPATTDVMTSYRVNLDAGGQLLGYHRVTRYHRGQVG